MDSYKLFNDYKDLKQVLNISKKTINRWLKNGINYRKKSGRKILSNKYEDMVKRKAV